METLTEVEYAKLDRKDVYMGKFPTSFVNRNYNVPIYRYFHFERLLEVIKTERLTLLKTKVWEDTFENLLYKTKTKIGSLAGHVELIYGHCWTLTKESDAMWRIYSPNKQGMRIKTTIDKLAEVARNEENYQTFSTRMRVISPVKYIPDNKIEKLVADYSLRSMPSSKDALDSLFIKRKEFEHEKEVRLIIHKTAKDEYSYPEEVMKTNIKFEINPNDFIEEITLDPRLNEMQTQLYLDIIKSSGYMGKVNKSTLYRNL